MDLAGEGGSPRGAQVAHREPALWWHWVQPQATLNCVVPTGSRPSTWIFSASRVGMSLFQPGPRKLGSSGHNLSLILIWALIFIPSVVWSTPDPELDTRPLSSPSPTTQIGAACLPSGLPHPAGESLTIGEWDREEDLASRTCRASRDPSPISDSATLYWVTSGKSQTCSGPLPLPLWNGNSNSFLPPGSNAPGWMSLKGWQQCPMRSLHSQSSQLSPRLSEPPKYPYIFVLTWGNHLSAISVQLERHKLAGEQRRNETHHEDLVRECTVVTQDPMFQTNSLHCSELLKVGNSRSGHHWKALKYIRSSNCLAVNNIFSPLPVRVREFITNVWRTLKM